jgi:hypothetical protein
MNAGKDLDVLIAKKVMGLDPMRAGPDDTIFTTDRDWVMPGEYWIYEEGRGYDHVPAYSIDIAAAWLVWKKAPALSPHKVMAFWAALRCLVAVRIDYDYRITDAMATFHMEPEDICKAMLEAHGMRMLPDWYYE